MPSRNVLREFAADNFYHIYNRGVASQAIYNDEADKQKFLSLFERHLDPANDKKRYDGVPYRKFDDDIELACYCLMDTHFHMLIYLKGDETAVSEFMRAISTAYTMYFNKRYNRAGALFQGVFKASRISSDSYLQHISRYIHLNPRSYKTYQFSSLAQFLGKPSPDWLKPDRVIEMFEGSDYRQFLEDYEGRKVALENLKNELANT